MTILLSVSLLALLIGFTCYYKDRRSLLVGIVLICGTLGLTFYFLFLISEKSHIFKIIISITIYILLPVIITMLGFLLIGNGKVMLTKEGRKLSNILSLVIGTNTIIVSILFYILLFYSSKLNIYLYTLLSFILIISLYLGFLFICYLIYSYIYQRIKINKSLNYIIVLGAKVKDNKVTPLLKGRLDKGIDIYYEQIIKGSSPKILVTGGNKFDNIVTEAYAMKDYLLSKNIKDSDIIIENNAKNTFENMVYSKEIMDLSGTYSCAFVTNNYHVFRSALYAKKVGLKAHGIGSPTAYYYLPSALIREYIAILKLYKWLSLFIITLSFIFMLFLLKL